MGIGFVDKIVALSRGWGWGEGGSSSPLTCPGPTQLGSHPNFYHHTPRRATCGCPMRSQTWQRMLMTMMISQVAGVVVRVIQARVLLWWGNPLLPARHEFFIVCLEFDDPYV